MLTAEDLSTRMQDIKEKYEVSAVQEEIYGIDVSHHNGEIDWKLVVDLSSPKVQFVFMKATEGSTVVSPKFAQNWAEISKTSLIKGAYHYYNTISESSKQAENFSNVLLSNGFDREGDLYAIDVEVNNSKQASKEFAQNLGVFVQAMQKRGFTTTPYFYTTKNFWDTNLGTHGVELLSQNNLWIARWYKNTGQVPPSQPTPEELPKGAKKWMVWQFTSKGKIPGILKEVDINLSREASFIQRAKLTKELEENMPLPGSLVSKIAAYTEDCSKSNYVLRK